MEFKPLYFGDKLTIVNPHGTLGVVTLWSRVDYVIERFRQRGGMRIHPHRQAQFTARPLPHFAALRGQVS